MYLQGRHLQQGLKNKKITVFPHRELSFVKKPVLKVQAFQYCVHVEWQVGCQASCLHVQSGCQHITGSETLPKLKGKVDLRK